MKLILILTCVQNAAKGKIEGNMNRVKYRVIRSETPMPLLFFGFLFFESTKSLKSA
jgi:hypothetical protein